ncbi:hypothetical protein [Euzebya sp.]|uniref:hypothetical protein n=1 Tax=Euzebya sp. TaxID=1971409 RepID=UPI003519225F
MTEVYVQELRADDLVVRGGVNTLDPDELYVQCLDAHDRYGVYGFSVFVGPDLDELGACVYNKKLSVARVGDLSDIYCSFFQTGDPPHHTLVVSDDLPSVERLTEVAAVFKVAVDNPNPKERRWRP